MCLLIHGEAGLRPGSACSDKQVRATNNGRAVPCRAARGASLRLAGSSRIESMRDGAGEDFGLVVSTGAAAGPMQRDGNDEVHIGKMRDGGKTSTQESAEEPAGGEVAAIFEGFGDLAVWTFIVHQGGGVGIIHGLRATVALQDCVEAVGQRVMWLDPVARERHVGGAGEA